MGREPQREMTAPRRTVAEPGRALPVRGRFDVVVAGGGVAGVAAAVAAARAGASACLIERACALGGLATLGNVTIWLPLCDGRGRQVIGGLAETMLQRVVGDLARDDRAAGPERIPPCWRPGGDVRQRRTTRYRAGFNPAACLLALEALVVEAGVTLLYDTRVCAVGAEGGRIDHVIVENKSGRGALACGAVVDATGDADVCFLAGEPTESLDTNVLSGWFYWLLDGSPRLEPLSHDYSPAGGRDDAEGPFFRGDDADDVTAHLVETRRLIRDRLAALRAAHPDADVQPIALPTVPGLRMTRRLVGPVSIGDRHVHQWFDDTVALTGDWRRAGPVHAVPLRALRAGRCRNLLAAGRCISADTTVWDVTRAIPTCAATGEAAGAAAALAVRDAAGDVGALVVEALQRHLRAGGALLGPDLVRPLRSPPAPG